MRRLALSIILTCALAFGQQGDPDFAQSVKEWTTRPEFLSPLVSELPVVPGIPTPKDVLGYHIGTPKKLTRSADIRRYFEALQNASPRLRIVEAGTTDEGRPCWSVLIADEQTLRDVETYRGYLQQLSDPRGLSEADAQQLLTKAKPIYHITAGLHSSETGPPEMVMELAYRLVAQSGAPYDAIRSNVIVMITPLLEPDGWDRYVEWYYRYKIHEEGEEDRIPGPPYWGKYIYHDNNRDMHFSQITMRNWLKSYLHWKPPVIHDLHESVPFLYTFSGQPPHNENLDPIVYGELPWFANFEMAKLTSYGMPGVWTHGFVDMWSVGYLGFVASNHNGLLRMYETYGNGGANTMKRKVDPRADNPNGPSKRQWYRPLPPYKEVEWSMRNNTNYMQTGMLAALELASLHPRTLVENFYRKSRNAVAAGEKDAPYGFVIPSGQREMTRVAWIVNTLRLQGIEVGTLRQETKFGDKSFPAGSYVVKRNQPYGRLAKSLLEKQNFPEGNLRTYDDTGWTMGLSAGAEVAEISDKALLETETVPLTSDVVVRGEVKGTGSVLAVMHNGANTLASFRWKLRDVAMEAAEAEFAVGEQKLPAGTLLLADSAQAREQVEALGLRASRLNAMPVVKRHTVDVPRVALYSTWSRTQPVGWVRHTLDHYGIAYDLIFKDRARQGQLRNSYDVILIPTHGGDGTDLVFESEPAKRPLAYTREGGDASLGMYGSTQDITGGMGLEGAHELEKFVKAGGVLITLGAASNFPPQFGIARGVSAGQTSSAFYAPGPIVEMQVKHKEHPLFYGYDKERLPVNYANGPVLRMRDHHKQQWSIAEYTGTSLSGLMRGAREVKENPAILDVPVGEGRVILFTTNPCYRWKNPGEFGMLFNALMHYNDRVESSAPEGK